MTAKGLKDTLQDAVQWLLAKLQENLVSATSDDNTTATVTTIFDSSDGMGINGVLAIGALLVGTLLVVAGYRLWQTTVYVLGFIGGGVVIAVIFEKAFKDEAWVLTASWTAFVVGGIIVGYVCLCLYRAGIFMGGAVGGAAFAILINTSFGYKLAPSHPSMVLLALSAVFAIVGGVSALWLQKPVLIAGTSMVGAFLLFWGIGYFAGNYPTFNDLERFRTYNSIGKLEYSIPSAWWGYLIGTLVVFCLSMVLQVCITGKDIDYHKLTRRGSEDMAELPHYGVTAPARVQFTNMDTPAVRPHYPQQQPYLASNQVQWEDLQNQQSANESAGKRSSK